MRRKAAATTSRGNSAGSGMPPAKETIPGWSRSFKSSRISEAVIRAARGAKCSVQSMVPSPFPCWWNPAPW
jgi:hypothetical protein